MTTERVSTVDPEWEAEFLSHYGVKGMKWGVRKRQPTSSLGTKIRARSDNRKRLRGLDKASKLSERKKRDTKIDTARQKLSKKTEKERNKEAKSKYKADRKVIGKHAAGVILAKSKNETLKVVEVSEQAKQGKETVYAILGTIGAAIATVAIRAYLEEKL